jgi:uncharacterized protein YbjT (DUF2867 family)
MRVWVTGASGFVGSNVVRVFADRHGAQVRGPSRGEVDAMLARLRDELVTEAAA